MNPLFSDNLNIKAIINAIPAYNHQTGIMNEINHPMSKKTIIGRTFFMGD
jgi:hypothetical protein